MTVLRMILIIIFLIAAVAITVVVLLQEGKSAGLGSIGGAGTSGDTYWDKNKKHSLEGKFERWTKMMAAALMVTAFILMFIPSSNKAKANVVTPSQKATQAAPTTSPAAGTEVTPSASTGTEVAPSTSPAAEASPVTPSK